MIKIYGVYCVAEERISPAPYGRKWECAGLMVHLAKVLIFVPIAKTTSEYLVRLKRFFMTKSTGSALQKRRF